MNQIHPSLNNLNLQKEFAPYRGSSTGAVARAVVELLVEFVETLSRHRVAPARSPALHQPQCGASVARGLRAGADGCSAIYAGGADCPMGRVNT